jgi:hypothetical protein
MPDTLRDAFVWAIALAIGFPVISVALAEIAHRLRRSARLSQSRWKRFAIWSCPPLRPWCC